jgi:hypothetical protein
MQSKDDEIFHLGVSFMVYQLMNTEGWGDDGVGV